MTGCTADIVMPEAQVCGDSGPDIVLLHGVGLQCASWEAQMVCLTKLGRVHALDLPGHGQSPMLTNDRPELADYVRSIQAYLYKRTQRPVVLIGHSLGALLAVSIAARSPELCRAIVALTPVFERSDESARAVQSRARSLLQANEDERLDEPVERWFGSSPATPDKPYANACRTWLSQVDLCAYQRAYQVFASTRGPSRSDLATIQCPALYLTGSDDRNSTPAMSKAMADLTPAGECLIIEDAAHMLQLTHAQQLNQILNDFITTLPTVSRAEHARLA